MLSNSQPCALVASVKFAATIHQRFPPEQPKHHLTHDQREAEGPQNSGSNLADQRSHMTLSAAEKERRLRILSVTQPGKYPILSRARPERDGPLLGHPCSKHAQAHRSRSLKLQAPLLAPIQPSQSAARTDRRPALRVQTEPIPRHLLKKKTKHVYAPCHSRAPLAPFLSAPARILSSISRLNPGGSIKLIQKKVHRSIFPENRQAPTTSPHCSVKIQKAVRKHRVQAHDEDNQVLQGLLKNNGRYSEDCDSQAKHVAEETPQLDNQKNTLLKRIPYTLQFRSPIRSSSVGSSQSSSSSNSKNTN
ncbi:hypothetical protein VP01_95g5 [Puccinia sorghi]|uniref:Uncharacterized protein n=1 Tax=Puccinia sorghi TaxID=27349 RepID=A0A0L6U674_9BASI|nr:hypothetical protein VP01_95g5 [Puccinia sorghi]